MDAGELPEDYHPYYSEGKSNEETLTWCYENGYRPVDEEVFIWNAFMTKRGWNSTNTRKDGNPVNQTPGSPFDHE